MSETLDGLQLAVVRRELAMLVAMADTAERPKPDVINPPGHAMPGRRSRSIGGGDRTARRQGAPDGLSGVEWIRAATPPCEAAYGRTMARDGSVAARLSAPTGRLAP